MVWLIYEYCTYLKLAMPWMYPKLPGLDLCARRCSDELSRPISFASRSANLATGPFARPNNDNPSTIYF